MCLLFHIPRSPNVGEWPARSMNTQSKWIWISSSSLPKGTSMHLLLVSQEDISCPQEAHSILDKTE